MAEATSECTLLLVDDEEANLDLLEGLLRADGYTSLVRVDDARRAAEAFETCAPDLVLLDLHMPHLDGFTLMRQFAELSPPGDYLPVLVLTADVTPEARDRALSSGARDFLTKPFDAVEVLLRVKNLLETRLLHRQQRRARERAEALAAENARLFEQAERASRARDRMLSVVAHDLRNPLAAVAMNAEMLLELLPPEASAYQRETLEIVCNASARMQRLIEDLLDVARIEHGSFSLQLDDHHPGLLLREAELFLRPAASARGVSMNFPRRVPAQPVRVDGARVVQVLGNLVGNAIKFTPAGGAVTVSSTAAARWWRVRVADTGPGIPAAQLPYLFDAFWQAREDDRRGVGLGLWIARTIVEAHGGTLTAESEEGVGTTFTVVFPLADRARRGSRPNGVDGRTASAAAGTAGTPAAAEPAPAARPG